MPTVRFTENIQRHVACPTREVAGATLRDVLDGYFRASASRAVACGVRGMVAVRGSSAAVALWTGADMSGISLKARDGVSACFAGLRL